MYRLLAFLLLAPMAGSGLAAAQSLVSAELFRAAEEGNPARVSALLRDGIPVDARDARRRTALLAATHANQVAVARVLLAAGADVNARDDIEDSPFLYAGA